MGLISNKRAAEPQPYISYNGIVFGDWDSPVVEGANPSLASIPPTFSIRGDYIWDATDRDIVGTRYMLTVTTIFVEANESALADAVQYIREKLSQPGKELIIAGMGDHFNTISHAEEFGPKPRGCQWTLLGQVSQQLTFTIEFVVNECSLRHATGFDALPGAWLAFNFDTTWQMDFEGLTTRTISGMLQVKSIRSDADTKKPAWTADQARDSILIICPVGFRRVNSVWRENDKKDRLDFVVTDTSLQGDSLPPGIISGSGNESFSSAGPGFVQATYTLQMSLRVAPNVNRVRALQIFLIICMTKQNKMHARLRGAFTEGGEAKSGSAIPQSISMQYGKFDNARDFSGTMTWTLTKCFNEMLIASAFWEPIPPNDYALWRGIEGATIGVGLLWRNRGINGLRSDPNEAGTIDLCLGTTAKVIGNTTSEYIIPADTNTMGLRCPEIPENGGWIGYEMKISVLRNDHHTEHRKAVDYNPQPESPQGQSGNSNNTDAPSDFPGPKYTQTGDDLHDIEYHGLPEVLVLVQFKGMRVSHHIEFPKVMSIDGKEAIHVRNSVDTEALAFELLGCPVWYLRGWVVYRVAGPVNKTTPPKKDDGCFPLPSDDNKGNY